MDMEKTIRMTDEQFLEIKKLLLDIKMSLLSVQGNQYAYQMVGDEIPPCDHIDTYETTGGRYCPKCGQTLPVY